MRVKKLRVWDFEVVGRFRDQAPFLVAKLEEQVHRRADALGKRFEVQDLALLGFEGVPAALGLLVDSARDDAGHRDRLGFVLLPIRARFDHDRRRRVGDEERVRRARFVLHAEIEAVDHRGRRRSEAGGRQPLQCRRIARRLDRDGRLLQRAIVEHRRRIELAARQVAAIDGDLRVLARLHDRRKDRVDPRRGRDGQPIKIVDARDLIREAEDANVVVAVSWQHRVVQGVVVVVAFVASEIGPVGAEDLDLDGELAVDARGQARKDDALAFLAGEDVVIDIDRRADHAADGAVQLDALGFRHVVVRFLLGELFVVADDERARIADAGLGNNAYILNT